LAALVIVAATGAEAAEARHFSFAYDQPHTTAYGIAADTFANKLQQLSNGTMVIDQFPGAQLGQEPQVLQKLRTGDIDFAITSTANSATVQPEAGVFSIHFVFRSEDHLKKALADPGVVAAFTEMMNSKVEGAHTLALGTMGFRDIYSKHQRVVLHPALDGTETIPSHRRRPVSISAIGPDLPPGRRVSVAHHTIGRF
jgi:TRAP-type C4-dicarboxylate transport system substrate-binding protein